jgi:hypothetical protein
VTRVTKAARRCPSLLERINPNAAGIDCGAAEHYVAVPPDRDPNPVRCFKAFTADLHQLANWLLACGVTTVAMEATGVYRIPLYEILEAHGLEVMLVNARHIKNVPGRKSDAMDFEWLRELHSVGLLRGSFRPATAIVELRGYVRHRETLVQITATAVHRIQSPPPRCRRHAGGTSQETTSHRSMPVPCCTRSRVQISPRSMPSARTTPPACFPRSALT